MKKFFLITISAALILPSFSQEVIIGLTENPVIAQEYQRLQALVDDQDSPRAEEQEPLLLPFFDDFSRPFIYPDPGKWLDKEAYVNTNFPYHSANIGAATLDAIDRKGKLHSNASTFPFLADSLTTLFIRLDSIFTPVPRSITVADSIYLSFFYQPQGRGNPPEEWDSLVLEFGYYTGNMAFANDFDSITVPLSDYILPDDTVRPGDTIYSPESCDPGLFLISLEELTYEDSVRVPCDSLFVPEYSWKWIWSSPGMTLQDFNALYGKDCRQVLIPIRDSALLYRKDFQFRFTNYASLASDYNSSWKSNCDQWNIDYVYLDINRSAGDSVYRQVNFAERAPSMLKNYEAMPYPQYLNDPTNEMADNIEMTITNLDSTEHIYTYYYNVFELNGTFEYLFHGGDCNLMPVYQSGFQNCISCAAHACPPVNFIYPVNPDQDSAEFEIRHYIIGDITPTDTMGDTIAYRQKFFNYYAYDDGSPEDGYGLTPAGAKLAYKFKLNVKDTLRAIQMYFNRAFNNANEQFFNIVVWRDNNGFPGEQVYVQQNMKVEFSENLNQFQTYMLDEPVPMSGIFYIGWEQLTAENLNLGYDRYNNAQQNIFYNATGEWSQSTFQGSLMMRPLLGKKFTLSGTPDILVNEPLIRVYPNPLAGDKISFLCSGKYEDSSETRNLNVSIFNILGVRIEELPFQPTLKVTLPAAGIYILRIADERGIVIVTTRLIKK